MFPGVGSKTVPVKLAEAELVTVPVAVEKTGAVMTKTIVPPIDMLTVVLRLPVPLAVAQAVVSAVAVPAEATAHVQLAPATLNMVLVNVSRTETSEAIAGPALATVTV